MNILQINKLYHPVIGGIETVVKNIAELLNNQNEYIVDVLACQTKGRRAMEKINGVRVFKAASFGKKMGMPLSLDFFSLFFKIFQQYNKFILHYPFPLAAFIAPFIPANKLIIYYHSDIIRQKLGSALISPFVKYSLKRADKILVGSHNLIESSPYLKPLKNKCTVVPFGLDINFSNDDYLQSEEIKKNYQNKKILLAVGRLVYYKGFQYAIETMESIDAQLLIIGTGPDEEKLINLITDLKLSDKISILPPQASLAPYFLACDLFLFPSVERSEAFGLVQLEAMAAGKPIINTYLHTGVEEVSINNETGITVTPRDANVLSTAIKTILSNSELRTKYGNQAKARYQQNYTLDKFKERIIEIL